MIHQIDPLEWQLKYVASGKDVNNQIDPLAWQLKYVDSVKDVINQIYPLEWQLNIRSECLVQFQMVINDTRNPPACNERVEQIYLL